MNTPNLLKKDKKLQYFRRQQTGLKQAKWSIQVAEIEALDEKMSVGQDIRANKGKIEALAKTYQKATQRAQETSRVWGDFLQRGLTDDSS